MANNPNASTFDEKLTELLDDAARNGVECFGDCDTSTEREIISNYLLSSYGADTFCDISINTHMALILSAPNRIDFERHRVSLCALLSDVARNAAEDYVDKVLPGKCHDNQFYAKQNAEIDRDQALSDAVFNLGATIARFNAQ